MGWKRSKGRCFGPKRSKEVQREDDYRSAPEEVEGRVHSEKKTLGKEKKSIENTKERKYVLSPVTQSARNLAPYDPEIQN